MLKFQQKRNIGKNKSHRVGCRLNLPPILFFYQGGIPIKILNLDQSTKATGFSVFDAGELVDYGLLEANPKSTTIERMRIMCEKIDNLIKQIQPDFVVFENIQLQGGVNTFQILAQLQGLVIGILYKFDLPFIIVEPSSWKSCCGVKGKKRAEQKENTKIFVMNEFGIQASEDECDAIGIGVWAINNISVETDVCI